MRSSVTMSDERVIPKALEGSRALVVGLGRSGTAAADLLVRHGAVVSVVDDDPAVLRAQDLARWTRRGVRLVEGRVGDAGLDRPDFLVVSPGVPPTSAWVRWAREGGTPVVGEIECAFWVARAPVAAVTGTNGKSTTAELLGAVVRAWGRPVEVVGNIGRAFSGAADRVPPDGWLVAEISSFQLETIDRFRPRVAIHLNLTPDHLDRYASIEEYAAAKERLFENQTAGDVAVLNRDDPRVWSARARTGARVLATSLAGPVEAGAWVDTDRVLARVGTETLVVADRRDVRLRGPHNLSNVLAVVAGALSMGVPPDVVAGVLATFAGLPHRMESVGAVRGVEFVNDSKATNVEAVVSALSSFSTPVVLIAGGRDKGLDFGPLGEMAGRIKHAVLIGESREEIARVLRPASSVEMAPSMEVAVRRAFRAAAPGEVVLLSPACASFDMFENFEHRGDVFRDEVRKVGSVER